MKFSILFVCLGMALVVHGGIDAPILRGGISRMGNFGNMDPGRYRSGISSYKVKISSAPAISAGKIFICKYDNKLYCYELSSGKQLWAMSLPGFCRVAPTVSGSTVYVGCIDNCLYAIDAGTGKIRWRFATGGMIFNSPLVVKNKIYFGSADGKVYCLSSEGKKLWSFKTGGNITSSPAGDIYNRIFIGSDDGCIYALAADSGRLRWRFKTGGAVTAIPAVYGGRVFVGSTDGTFYALRAPNGALVWKFKTGGALRASAAAIDGVVYVAGMDSRVYALDCRSGSLKWKFAALDSIELAPAIVNGWVYVYGRDRKVYILNAASGMLKSQLNLKYNSSIPLVAAGGYFYHGSNQDRYLSIFPVQKRGRATRVSSTASRTRAKTLPQRDKRSLGTAVALTPKKRVTGTTAIVKTKKPSGGTVVATKQKKRLQLLKGFRVFEDPSTKNSFYMLKSLTQELKKNKYQFRNKSKSVFITYEAMPYKRNGGKYANARELVMHLGAKMKKYFKAEVLKVELVKIDGCSGYRMIFTWQLKNTKLQQVETTLDGQKHIYSFGLITTPKIYPKVRKIYDYIVASFNRGNAGGSAITTVAKASKPVSISNSTSELKKIDVSSFNTTFSVPKSYKLRRKGDKYEFIGENGNIYLYFKPMKYTRDGGKYKSSADMISYLAGAMTSKFKAQINSVIPCRAAGLTGKKLDFSWKLKTTPLRQQEVALDGKKYIYTFGFLCGTRYYDKANAVFSQFLGSVLIKE